LRYTGASAGN